MAIPVGMPYHPLPRLSMSNGWTEENGSIVTLHFGKLNFGTPETFKRGEVVKSIPAKKGDDSEYGTRFYVFGSTRNLTKEYGQSEQGGVTNHVSEVRLRLPDGQQYIDARPGLTKNEIKEVVVVFRRHLLRRTRKPSLR